MWQLCALQKCKNGVKCEQETGERMFGILVLSDFRCSYPYINVDANIFLCVYRCMYMHRHRYTFINELTYRCSWPVIMIVNKILFSIFFPHLSLNILMKKLHPRFHYLIRCSCIYMFNSAPGCKFEYSFMDCMNILLF